MAVYNCTCLHDTNMHDELGCFGRNGACVCEGQAVYFDDVMDRGKRKVLTIEDMIGGFGTAQLKLDGCVCDHPLLAHNTSACWATLPGGGTCHCAGRIVRDTGSSQAILPCCDCESLEAALVCACWCHKPAIPAPCCSHEDTWTEILACKCDCHIVEPAELDGTPLSESANVCAAIVEATKQLAEEDRIKQAQERIRSEMRQGG